MRIIKVDLTLFFVTRVVLRLLVLPKVFDVGQIL
ncbi:MAG: hypothetical protein N4J56_006997 [Chroococcidiopsis sp. SAG 2025]|nr:hypothetical protein [Chroococcidiopsis sp. SAG 2025]